MNIETETWKQLDPSIYGPKYSISDKGRLRIKTLKGYKYRTGSVTTNLTHTKYIKASLSFNGVSYTRLMHRLVAEAFIPNPENKSMVNHIDFDGTNNDVSNLEWVTHSENMKHSANNIKPYDKKKSEKKRLETIMLNEFSSNVLLIGSNLGGRTLIGINYSPNKTHIWNGLFKCHNCKQDFSAPLRQSFIRHELGEKQFCRKCSHKRDEDIVEPA